MLGLSTGGVCSLKRSFSQRFFFMFKQVIESRSYPPLFCKKRPCVEVPKHIQHAHVTELNGASEIGTRNPSMILDPHYRWLSRR